MNCGRLIPVVILMSVLSGLAHVQTESLKSSAALCAFRNRGRRTRSAVAWCG